MPTDDENLELLDKLMAVIDDHINEQGRLLEARDADEIDRNVILFGALKQIGFASGLTAVKLCENGDEEGVQDCVQIVTSGAEQIVRDYQHGIKAEVLTKDLIDRIMRDQKGNSHE